MHVSSGRWLFGLLLALTTAVLWGILPIKLKEVLQVMDPITVTWYRLLVSGVLLLTACGSYSPLNWLTPHTIDVQQGNYVTQDVVDKLQPGMTQAQVRFLLGTPLMADMFHANRWDYVYYRKAGKQAPEQRKFALFFDGNGRLERSEPPLDELPKLPVTTL